MNALIGITANAVAIFAALGALLLIIVLLCIKIARDKRQLKRFADILHGQEQRAGTLAGSAENSQRRIAELEDALKTQESTIAQQSADNMQQMERFLSQQQLLTEISNSFISDGNISALIYNAMDMTAMVADCDDMSLAVYDKEEGYMRERVAWHDSSKGNASRPSYEAPMKLGNRYFDSFVNKHLSYDIIPASGPDSTMVLEMPLRIADDFIGLLRFARGGLAEPWDEAIINLANTLSSILAGVINRERLTIDLNRMSAIVKHSPDLIAFYHAERGMQYFNPAYEQVTGFSYDELAKSEGYCVHKQEDLDLLYQKMLPVAMEKGVASGDVKVVRKTGEELIMLFTVFPVRNGEDEGLGSIAVDVTEQRELAHDLIEAKETAERSNRAKTAFLANMSHEIRTPMNAIIGMTNIAKKSDSMDTIKKSLEQISISSGHLLEIINNILDMSKIEAEKLELSPTSFSLRALLNTVYSIVSVRAQEKKQSVTFIVPDEVPDFYYADALRLTQAMTNLLYNAIKFSADMAPIVMEIVMLEQKPESVHLRFNVVDQGIGMTEEQIERLFVPFEQADDGISRKYGGTGLGLALTKNIVGMFGGELTVESEIGEGSTFVMILELKLDDNAGRAEDGDALLAQLSFQGKRVLVVDDVAINRQIIALLLNEKDGLTEEAEDGRVAVDMVRNDPERYGLVLMDIQMPVLDGYAATKLIQEIKPELPIVAMTANAFKEDVERAKSCGMVDHIAKPIQEDNLYRVIQKHIL